MWTAKEMNEFRQTNPSYAGKFKVCPSCSLFIDNRNWTRHVKSCFRKRRKARNASMNDETKKLDAIVKGAEADELLGYSV